MTKQEKIDAVLTVADAYAHRGSALQYNQLSMDRVVRVTPRRQRGMSPEAATEQHIGFLDCSSFVWSVYREAFGLEMRSDLTWYMTEMTDLCAFSYTPTHTETEEERAAVIAQMKSVLEPGDIIVYAKGVGTSGHAMLYIGEGRLLHCCWVKNGGDYDYKECRNRLGDDGGLTYDSVDMLFHAPDDTPAARRSLFGKDKKCFVVLRPLMKECDVTENTLRRMEGCRKLDMAVLSNPAGGRNASVGEEITYTLRLNNRGGERTVRVGFKPPKGTVLLSGRSVEAEIVEGGRLSLEFPVRIESAEGPQLDAPVVTVNGFTVAAPRVSVGGKLTSQDHYQLMNEFLGGIAEKVKFIDGKSEPEIVRKNSVYAAARDAYRTFGLLLPDTPEEALGKLFVLYDALSGDVLWRRRQDPAVDMAAYALFGGTGVITPEISENGWMRAQYISLADLMPGDLILTADSALFDSARAFLYDGDSLYGFAGNDESEIFMARWDAEEFIDSLLGRFVFVVLRPFLGR